MKIYVNIYFKNYHPQSQSGIYGAPALTSVGSDTNNFSSDTAISSSGRLPPSMHGRIPYNLALISSQMDILVYFWKSYIIKLDKKMCFFQKIFLMKIFIRLIMIAFS